MKKKITEEEQKITKFEKKIQQLYMPENSSEDRKRCNNTYVAGEKTM